ncbi:thioesterase-like superfamily-domain-containing protein [Xylariaceae sp. FL0662B]|nr:thioesterase-like superfamily-domain-containing protein [Xylariaceae sp. FL0662B]
MPGPTLIEAHVAVVRSPDGEPDTYINANPPWTPPEGVRAIFGGFLLAQSVSAANETVDTTALALHSLQSTFVRAGNAAEPVVYSVERTADGRASATRRVRATQQGGRRASPPPLLLYVATVGYRRPDSSTRGRTVLRYGPAMPDLGRATPDDPGLRGSARRMRLRMGDTERAIDGGPPDPFEWRALPWEGPARSTPEQFRLRCFVRALSPLETGRRAVHAAALAFLADEWFLGVPSLANPELVAGRKPGEAVALSTMNQSAWFHSSAARADEWLVCERETSWAADGRVLVGQRFWSLETGELVLSCFQEGLFRILKGAKM